MTFSYYLHDRAAWAGAAAVIVLAAVMFVLARRLLCGPRCDACADTGLVLNQFPCPACQDWPGPRQDGPEAAETAEQAAAADDAWADTLHATDSPLRAGHERLADTDEMGAIGWFAAWELEQAAWLASELEREDPSPLGWPGVHVLDEWLAGTPLAETPWCRP
jgi:hypothetical protein